MEINQRNALGNNTARNTGVADSYAVLSEFMTKSIEYEVCYDIK